MGQNLLQLLLAFGFLLLLSVFASKMTSRFGIPVLLIFIFIGILSGPHGPGGMDLIEAENVHLLGTIALIFILFSGGLSTDLKLIRKIWKPGLILSSFGVVICTFIMGLVIQLATGWGFIFSSLLGATISSTDAAAVFNMLKARKLGLKGNLRSLLEFESGSNDPMAVFLTLGLIQLVLTPSDFSWAKLLGSFLLQMSLGILIGQILGKSMAKIINYLDLEFEGLYPVLTIAGVVCIYSLSESFGGNGFLSVYVAGLSMSSEDYLNRRTLVVFHDGLAWLMQVAMFLSMGLLVNPSRILSVLWPGLIFSLALIVLARPLSVGLCLFPFRYTCKEVWFLSWGGPRGAVPIILATYLLVEKIPHSETLFNLVFLIVITTTLIQGPSMGAMSRWMKVQEAIKVPKKLPFKSRHRQSEFIEFFIGPHSPVKGKSIFELHLPKDILVVLIHRHGKDFIPRERTKIEGQDRIVCLAAKSSIPKTEAIFGSEHFLERKIG